MPLTVLNPSWSFDSPMRYIRVSRYPLSNIGADVFDGQFDLLVPGGVCSPLLTTPWPISSSPAGYALPSLPPRG